MVMNGKKTGSDGCDAVWVKLGDKQPIFLDNPNKNAI